MTEKPKADDNAADIETAKAEAAKTAVAAYQTRRKNVMALEEAKGREALAETLIDTDLSEEAIKGALAAAPKPGAPQTGRPSTSSYHDQRLQAVAGLGKPEGSTSNRTEMRVDIVADMKRRHGAN